MELKISTLIKNHSEAKYSSQIADTTLSEVEGIKSSLLKVTKSPQRIYELESRIETLQDENKQLLEQTFEASSKRS